ncbi:PIN domain-containing protein [bacterium]|jgi:predicted nucleic acid-binding protein|nr:PIN domain-containing protein [bacterium]
MKVIFDTSVLVSSLVSDLKNHEASLDCFLRYTKKPHTGVCSSHTLAECYSTLTALPLKRRIQPLEAKLLIEKTLLERLSVVSLNPALYRMALDRVSSLGLVSGVIYDALHLLCGEKQKCDRLYTYNLSHFHRLGSKGVIISAP